jgi:hypothetical protein
MEVGGVFSPPLNCHALINQNIFSGEKFPFSKIKQQLNNRKMEQLLCVHLQVERNGGDNSEDEEPSTFRGSEEGEKRMPTS